MAARKKLTTRFLVAALVALSVSVVLAFAIWPTRHGCGSAVRDPRSKARTGTK